ncbi:MAG: UDP-N-acetylglucosamine--N-acetylmuramyl-(pentapeptide) pyrophosphoryl-undecaprenol N-acetylglucosamine transferase, partial [Ectothiorhodospiraceae bacterium]
HEQNAIAGMTNRWLAKLARRVLTGFDRPFPGAPNAVFVGNPVRAAIGGTAAPAERYAAHNGAMRLLVVGGSLGARALNQLVPAALAGLPAERRPVVRHQAGARTMELARQAYREHGVEAELVEFIEDMGAAYDWADLVVCRAGALTVAELAAAGVPALFVPFPYAVDDHQTANARFLADAGAAVIAQERELDADALAARLSELLADRARLVQMAQKAREKGRPEAASVVADVCLEVAR